MRKFIVMLVAVQFIWSTKLLAQVVPPNLPAGSQYQIIFVTSGTDTSTSSNIADYNNFVAAQAALSSSLPAATWKAVASTANNSAHTNAPWISGLPVYNTEGILVASASNGLYTSSGSLLSAVQYDQNGATVSSIVWTGSNGLGNSLSPLGGTSPGFGSSGAANLDWIHDSASTTQTQLPLYALSSAIMAVPEPASITLLCGAVALLAGGAKFFRSDKLAAKQIL